MRPASTRSRWSDTALRDASSSPSSAAASGRRRRSASAGRPDPVPVPARSNGSAGPRARRPHRARDAHLKHEYALRMAGYEHVAGIDEVGRGSLAGPVVAAAVILPRQPRIKGLRDSKVLTRLQRERLYEQILDRAEAVGVGLMEVDVIDSVNILQATKLAMGEAVARLVVRPDHLVIDALSLPYVDLPQRPIIDGDAISAS